MNKNKLLKISIFILFLIFSEVSFAQIKIGDKSPNLNITNWIQNQPKSISLKDKFIVIDFWATWCAPCLASMAHMNKLVVENKSKNNLIFLAISDEKKEKISPILSRVYFKASVVTDTTEQTQNNFKLNSIPYCIILDDKGFIRWIGDPAKLTNDIIQKIVARKHLDAINNDETSGHFEKQYDSLKREYRNIYFNDSIKEYFSLGSFLREGYGDGYKLSANFTNSLRKVEIGVKLKDIISEQLSITSSQISLPSDLDSAYSSYCYKSEKRLKGEDILSSILTTAKLTYHKIDSIQDVFFVEVLNSNILNINFLKPGAGQSDLSVSDDGKFISMSNSSMSSMVSALQDRFGYPIVFKDSSILDKRLDMMLQTDNFKTLKKSLQIYGLSIKEIKEALPFVTVVHK